MRRTADPAFEAAHVGVLDVSDADTNWHALTSADFYDQTSGTVATKLADGLVFVGLVVDGSEMAGANAFRFRLGDVEAVDAGSAAANSWKVAAGGASSQNFRGIGANTAMSYRQGTASDAVQLVAYFEPA